MDCILVGWVISKWGWDPQKSTICFKLYAFYKPDQKQIKIIKCQSHNFLDKDNWHLSWCTKHYFWLCFSQGLHVAEGYFQYTFLSSSSYATWTWSYLRQINSFHSFLKWSEYKLKKQLSRFKQTEDCILECLRKSCFVF